MIPYEFDAERFSRWIAYVLRHNPERYGLQTDRHGYVGLQEFLTIAQRRYPGIGLDRLREALTSTGTDRFEVTTDRLRARYGHSIPVEPTGGPVTPPPALYHGTPASDREAIRAQGLKPIERRYLHLSQDAEEARAIALRKAPLVDVWQVNTEAASRAGATFYREGRIYLTGLIAPVWLLLL